MVREGLPQQCGTWAENSCVKNPGTASRAGRNSKCGGVEEATGWMWPEGRGEEAKDGGPGRGEITGGALVLISCCPGRKQGAHSGELDQVTGYRGLGGVGRILTQGDKLPGASSRAPWWPPLVQQQSGEATHCPCRRLPAAFIRGTWPRREVVSGTEISDGQGALLRGTDTDVGTHVRML